MSRTAFGRLASVALSLVASGAGTSGCFFSVADLVPADQLASAQNTPWAIAVDSVRVYWTNGALAGGAVMSCPVAASCSAPTALATDQQGPRSIALDDGNVFWGTVGDGALRGTPKDAKGTDPFPLAQDQGNVSAVTYTSNRLYWSKSLDGPLTFCDLVDTDHNGCKAAPADIGDQSMFMPPLHTVDAIAVDPPFVYWAEDALVGRVGSCTTWEPSMMQGPPDCDPPITFASEQHHPTSIAFDSDSVYWTNSRDGTVVAFTKGAAGAADAGNAPRTLASGQATPTGIAVDSSKVFWTNFGNEGMGDGSVMMADKDGSHVVAIASNQAAPVGIAIDAGHVYWTNSQDGTVWTAQR